MKWKIQEGGRCVKTTSDRHRREFRERKVQVCGQAGRREIAGRALAGTLGHGRI